ncbi:hypothetical protein [Blautia hansenii]|uniref:hypothetical protein n=1 Tax=Blautia hansenii TaxID=1322 RepID=UPI0022E1A20F|nr:hypothetical protein [Blautia hansenii]
MNKSIVIGKIIQLDAIKPFNPLFLLLGISPLEEWVDGKKTGKITGYAYECVDCTNFDKFKFKIKEQTKPLMSNEDLQKLRETGAKVVVEFLEPTVLVYWSSATKTYQDSFSAKDVTLIEKLD